MWAFSDLFLELSLAVCVPLDLVGVLLGSVVLGEV